MLFPIQRRLFIFPMHSIHHAILTSFVQSLPLIFRFIRDLHPALIVSWTTSLTLGFLKRVSSATHLTSPSAALTFKLLFESLLYAPSRSLRMLKIRHRFLAPSLGCNCSLFLEITHQILFFSCGVRLFYLIFQRLSLSTSLVYYRVCGIPALRCLGSVHCSSCSIRQ